jgi:hypothetical protein
MVTKSKLKRPQKNTTVEERDGCVFGCGVFFAVSG